MSELSPALVIGIAFLTATACLAAGMLIALWWMLPPSERSAGVWTTASLGALGGIVMSWSAYDPNDTKTANIPVLLIGPAAVVATMTAVGLSLLGISILRRSAERAASESQSTNSIQ